MKSAAGAPGVGTAGGVGSGVGTGGKIGGAGSTGVGGVMGGFDSSITDETTDVLLEVAYFKRESIRQTSRNLKLSTEASHHFERGVDIENLV